MKGGRRKEYNLSPEEVFSERGILSHWWGGGGRAKGRGEHHLLDMQGLLFPER